MKRNVFYFFIFFVPASLIFHQVTFAGEGNSHKKLFIERNLFELSYQVKFDANNKDYAMLKIYDHEQNLLVDEVYDRLNVLDKAVDFKTFAEGKYSFEIIHGTDTLRQMVQHKRSVFNDIKIFLKPEAQRSKFQLRVVGIINEPVIVEIYDDKNRLVYDDYILIFDSFAKSYDLSRIKSGAVTFKVICQDGVMEKTVSAR
jgi:ribosome maturation factor RimP